MPKFFARRDFANNLQPPLEIDGAIHERHIHKGAEVVIGDPKIEFKDLPERSPLRPFIAQLYAAECLIEASDEKGAKRLKNELAAEEQSKKATAKLQAGASNVEAIDARIAAAVAKALEAAGVKKAA